MPTPRIRFHGVTHYSTRWAVYNKVPPYEERRAFAFKRVSNVFFFFLPDLVVSITKYRPVHEQKKSFLLKKKKGTARERGRAESKSCGEWSRPLVQRKRGRYAGKKQSWKITTPNTDTDALVLLTKKEQKRFRAMNNKK